MDYKTCEIILRVTKQSPDISQSVHENKKQEDLGAGDQGHMFGYSSDETKELFPYSHLLALQLSTRLTEVRKDGTLKYLRPDGKTQVIIEYKNDKGVMIPVRIHNILISTQHDEVVSNEELRKGVKEQVIDKCVNKELIDEKTQIVINPSEKFIIGGPEADAGLTGRKIIVDTYGGWGAHGGGAFSGKDPSKVDRSAAYAARWVAKSLVAAGLCKRVLVQISYSIGIADPLSVHVDTYGTVCEGLNDRDLFQIVCDNFNLRPGAIINDLKLKRPIYTKTSTGGHFGRNDTDFTWETPKKLNINKK